MTIQSSHEPPISLDQVRAKKFLDHLVGDPFMCLVVTDDGEVSIFSKDLDPEHLARIKKMLHDIEQETL